MKWILILLILVGSIKGLSAEAFAKNVLQNVSSDLSERGLTVRFEFDSPVVNPAEPLFSNTSVRIDIPQASVRPKKRFFYTGDSRIPQIFASQLNATTLRVQFVLGEKLPFLKENFQVEDQGRSLVVHIFKKGEDLLSEFLARAASRIDSNEKLSEELVNGQTPVPEEEISVSNIAKPWATESGGNFLLKQIANKSPEARIPTAPAARMDESNGFNANKPLDPVAITVRTFAMFALVLALIFLIFFVFKKYVLKNTLFGGNEKFVRVLGSGFLGPKKSIVMVEVAGEVLVLGISNDNISLLTQIQDKDKIEEIKASRKDMSVGGFWNSGKNNDRAQDNAEPKTRLEGAFANYLKQFSKTSTEKEKSVEEVAGLIRKSTRKLKTS